MIILPASPLPPQAPINTIIDWFSEWIDSLCPWSFEAQSSSLLSWKKHPSFPFRFIGYKMPISLSNLQSMFSIEFKRYWGVIHCSRLMIQTYSKTHLPSFFILYSIFEASLYRYSFRDSYETPKSMEISYTMRNPPYILHNILSM